MIERTTADRVVVVTGASSGIGRAIALRLAAEKATVCIIGRKLQSLEDVANCADSNNRIRAYRADLTDDQDIRRLADALRRDFGHIAVLVHSAAIIALGTLARATLAEFDLQYRTNVRSPYALTQALLPIIQKCRGQIVFINSTNGLKARATAGQYSATKHALKAVADSLRDEVNGDGIRVVNMFLGRTATPMQAAISQHEHRIYQPELLLNPDDIATTLVSILSLPPTAEVTDIVIRPAIKSYSQFR